MANYLYFRLKDRISSRGLNVAGVAYNNATVSCYEKGKVPTQVQVAVRAHQLEFCDKADFDKRQAELKAAAEYAEKIKEAKRLQKERKRAVKQGKAAQEVAPVEKELEQIEQAKKEAEAENEAVKISAAAQKMIDDNQLDAAEIKGTGKDGNITKGDVEDYLQSLEDDRF